MSALRQASSGIAPPDRNLEFTFGIEDFRQIADALYADAGIAMSEQKMSLVYSRLIKRLRALGLSSFKDYVALIHDPSGVEERQRMMAALTTNVTRFMREPHHFEDLKSVVLPPLLKQAQQRGRVRIWSAGCSSGQEPYSIALTILSLMPNAAEYDIKILATDIDPNMIATGQAGLYAASEIEEMNKSDKTRWFQPASNQPGMYSVSDAMRSLVSFKKLNLMAAWPMRGAFQIIFCRNVVIYFDEPTQGKIWGRYAAALAPGGRLYIGHSERLSGPAKSLFTSVGATMYQLSGEPS